MEIILNKPKSTDINESPERCNIITTSALGTGCPAVSKWRRKGRNNREKKKKRTTKNRLFRFEIFKLIVFGYFGTSPRRHTYPSFAGFHVYRWSDNCVRGNVEIIRFPVKFHAGLLIHGQYQSLKFAIWNKIWYLRPPTIKYKRFYSVRTERQVLTVVYFSRFLLGFVFFLSKFNCHVTLFGNYVSVHSARCRKIQITITFTVLIMKWYRFFFPPPSFSVYE